MKRLLWLILLAVSWTDAAAQEPDSQSAASEPTSCIKCHSESELWEGPTRHLYVAEQDLVDDIHWQKGLRCHDCHGGNPATTDFSEAHTPQSGFRSVKLPADIPEFCGHCHSNIDFMSRYQPSPPTTQVAEYWTSGHGKRLKDQGDIKVATCVSCHGGHGMQAVKDVDSPVYPTQVAKTCAKCHADAERMAGYEHQGKPLGHGQFDDWSKSVHAEQMLKKGDLSAATCNDCHSNHGTVVAEVATVTHVCGKCHVKVADLFTQTLMKHRFEEVGLPGCAVCHGNHDIRQPSDEMLGMQGDTVCVKCHQDGKFGATLAGQTQARAMREGLDKLKHAITTAESKIEAAERLGMEVRGPQFDLRSARQSLTNARSLVHGFAFAPMSEVIEQGLKTTSEVDQRAQGAFDQHTYRRVWLGISLLPILVVVCLLIAYIRTLPTPDAPHQAAS